MEDVIQQRRVLYSCDEPVRVRFESLELGHFFDFELVMGPPPRDYADVFAVQAEAVFVPAESAPSLGMMARSETFSCTNTSQSKTSGWPRA